MGDNVRITQDNSDELVRKIQEVTQAGPTDPYILLSSTFIQENTTFSTIDELLSAAGITEKATDIDDLYSDPVNEVVATNSDFSDMHEMLTKAATEHMTRQINEQMGS